MTTSPFPGMDPYLEHPGWFPDLHDSMIHEIRGVLNRTLPAGYHAQAQSREEVGIAEFTSKRIVPDVAVHAEATRQVGATATLERTAISDSFEVGFLDDPTSVAFLEIRQSHFPQDVVTLIEVLSPSNKRTGPDFDEYAAKRKQLISSNVSLVEIDLLRNGNRGVFGGRLCDRLDECDPPADYCVVVSRAWDNIPFHRSQVYPVPLTSRLPVVSIPLKQGDVEVALDLQAVFAAAYANGPYGRSDACYNSDYAPKLTGKLRDWADALVKPRRASL